MGYLTLDALEQNLLQERLHHVIRRGTDGGRLDRRPGRCQLVRRGQPLVVGDEVEIGEGIARSLRG
jgi:hypothetical protein